jgi:murein DD-endopeptidase MepM/ murein hydrolase activator NlpD
MAMLKLKSPVGNSAERDSIWPGGWKNRNGFAISYTLDNGTPMGFHTGVDLVRRDGGQQGKPVFAIADGIVKFADFIPLSISTTWGNIVVIYHGMVVDDEDGKIKQLFSRYAHLQGFAVHKDQPVDSNTQIGTIGSGPPKAGMGAHLHFDISLGDALFKNAADWSTKTEGLVRLHYRDPEIWLKRQPTLINDANGKAVSDNLQPSAPSPAASPVASPVASQESWVVTTTTQMRLGPELNSPGFDVGPGASFLLEKNAREQILDNSIWVQISDRSDISPGGWVKKKDNSQTYIAKQ